MRTKTISKKRRRAAAGTAPFDYPTTESRRGYFAPVVNATGHTIILTEYPATLFALGRVGLLTGIALREYEELAHEPMPGVPPILPDLTSARRHLVDHAGFV